MNDRMKRIAFFSYDLRIGGAEKMVVTLLPKFADAGYLVDLVLVNQGGELLSQADPRVNIVNLGKSHSASALFPLISYLRKNSPDVLISNLTHLNNVAILARRLSGASAMLIATEHSTISLNNLAKGGKERWLVQISRLLYPSADKIIVVSAGAAKDLQETLKISAGKIGVIHNPIHPEQIRRLKEEPVDDPWLSDKTIPLLLSVGRLAKEKNYPFMLDVFRQVTEKRKVRLMILGEGEERPVLEQMVRDLRLADVVRMPGSIRNPYPYMAHAAIMLCTSHYEGFNIALAEALACGTPVISVDCPHGPAEILDNGRYGTLIPIGEKDRMAEAIIRGLEHPETLPSPTVLQQRAEIFSVDKVFADYQRTIAGIARYRSETK